MNCPNCRTANPDQAVHCRQCGLPLPSVDDSATVMPSSSGIQGKAAVAGGSGGSSASSMLTVGDAAASGSPAAATARPLVDFGPRYRVEKMLGEGGMGAVYKAYDKELDRMVALKLVRPELTSDPGVTQRFKQELLLASKISHKNILRIHDLGEAGGLKFISMAFIEGQDLHQIIASQGRLPLDRALSFARQLCGALEAAHSEGVVHRDLKPQNILVDSSDNIYVSDFGLAKSLEADTSMTRTGQFLGTPRYMSPEQAEGKAVDHRSDLYAFGLILCEMLSGDIPFDSTGSALQMMFQRVQADPKKPKELNPEMPDYLATIIEKCLVRDVEQRYQNARDILADLDAGRAPTISRVAGARSVQITLPTARKTWMMGAGGLVLVLAALLAIPSVRHAIFRTGGTSVPQAPVVEAKHVAVLPFRVLGDQKSLDYVADGLTDAVSAKLFRIKGVNLVSPEAAQKVPAAEPVEKTAHELGVNYVVRGTVQGAGDKVRIVVSLDPVGVKGQPWKEEFSGLRQDLLTLEDQIFSKLITAVELKSTPEELARSAAHPTENFESYELYLKGRSAFRNRDEKGARAAAALFNQALEKDPRFALALAGIADASLEMYRLKKENVWADRALAAAQQAQSINDSLPEVHLALGSVYRLTGKNAEAAAELKRALELAPSSDEVYRRLGSAMLELNQKPQAIENYKKAIQINPYYWVNYNQLGLAQLQSGDTSAALAAFKKVVELEPNNAVGHANLGLVYYRQGKWAECIPEYEKAIALEPNFATYSNLGAAYFYLKRYDNAVKAYEKAVELNPNEEIAVGNLADAYRATGRSQEANASYSKAIVLASRALQVNPRNTSAMEGLALYYAKKGDGKSALNFIRRARAINNTDVSLIYTEAVVNALGGRPAEAVAALQAAFEKGYPAREARNDPELSSLQGRPDFEALEKKYGN